MLSIILPCSNCPDVQKLSAEIEEMFQHMDIQIIVSNDPERQGKGFAVRQGIMAATGDVICLLDGDGDVPPRMIKRLLPFLSDYDVVCGTKPISGILSRRILTFLSRYYLAVMFGVKVDSQTGIKLYKRESLSEFYSNGFLFDLELLCKAKKKGMKIIEVPIECKSAYKKMKLQSIWNTLKESVTLWLELR